jgi:hypothetical protein
MRTAARILNFFSVFLSVQGKWISYWRKKAFDAQLGEQQHDQAELGGGVEVSTDSHANSTRALIPMERSK